MRSIKAVVSFELQMGGHLSSVNLQASQLTSVSLAFLLGKGTVKPNFLTPKKKATVELSAS